MHKYVTLGVIKVIRKIKSRIGKTKRQLQQYSARLVRKLPLKKPLFRYVALSVVVVGFYAAGFSFSYYNTSNSEDLLRAGNSSEAKQKEAIEATQPTEEQLKGFEKKTSGRCNGQYKVNVPEHSRAYDFKELCSHGPDTAAAVNANSSAKSSGGAVPCYGDGQSGYRVQAVYAVSSDREDRYDQFLSNFRSWAGAVDYSVNESGKKTGSELHIKWKTDDNCLLDVQKIIMDEDDDDYFSSTIYALRRAGLDSSTTKYLVWTDAERYCGVGTIYNDDRPDPVSNLNNVGTTSYSRIDTPCWGTITAETHELFHNLGSVQLSAPNNENNLSFHCVDEYDTMCYPDGAGVQMRYVCPYENEFLLDCNNDDYLNADPPAGSYLATHWNTYNSSFLYSKIIADSEAPSSPTNLTAQAQPLRIELAWEASSDSISPTLTYNVYRYAGAGKYDWLASVSDTNYKDFSVQPNTQYQYHVVAIDDAGNFSAPSNSAFAKTLDVSTTDPGDITPPPSATNLRVSNITQQGMLLQWDWPDQDLSDINKVEVLVKSSSTTTYPTSGNLAKQFDLCCKLQPNTSYLLYVKTTDTAGNFTYSSYLPASTIAIPPPTFEISDTIPYNLQLSSENGSRLEMTATIKTTKYGVDQKSVYYKFAANGTTSSVAHYLGVANGPKSVTFVFPHLRPQDLSGLYVKVFDYASNLQIATSAVLTYSFSGSPETNPPPSVGGLGHKIENGKNLVYWTDVIDDSGLVYDYYFTLTGPGGYSYSNKTWYRNWSYWGAITPGSTYTFTTYAEDIWGNNSPTSQFNFVAQ